MPNWPFLPPSIAAVPSTIPAARIFAATANDEPMNSPEIDYPCVGICMIDPDSGYCLGCGRPPLPVPSGDQQIVTEELRLPLAPAQSSDPDSSGAG